MKGLMLIAACTWFSFLSFGQLQNTSKQIVAERVNELKTINNDAQLKQKLNELHKGQSEEDLQVLYTYYSSQKEGTKKAQEISELGVQKFPKGGFAFSKALATAEAEKDLDKKEQLFKKLVKEFPNNNADMLTFSLAREFAAKGDTKRMLEYFRKMDSQNRQGAYMNLLYTLAFKNPKDAEPMLQPVVDSLKIAVSSAGDPTDRRAQAGLNNYYAVAAAYGQALLSNGKAEAGYKIAKELVEQAVNRSKSVSALYLRTLLATGRFSEALPLAEEAVKAGDASDEVKAKLKDAYVAVKGSAQGYESYLNQLQQAADQRYLEEVMKKAVHEPSKDFTLKDVDGNTVRLSELKGKVVVLDFWATWCGPCKASFPSMQKAVDKYKNDPNVRFLFVHTLDRPGGDATKGAKEYITQNKYTFDVIMDLRDLETGRSKVADDYKVQGIPTKIIIDPQGNVRFRTTGFGGTEEAAVKELSIMIERAREAS